MDQLYWPLDVLSRSVHYKNLTGAAAHVGLSQPQLSRVIKRLEDELNVILLDRVTKRKSSWTPTAFKLAELYTDSHRRLHSTILELQENFEPKELRIATLEGLANLGLDFSDSLLKQTSIEFLELHVLDQNELEEKFLNSELDVIFTSRSPSKQKWRHEVQLGFQKLNKVSTSLNTEVLSTFEYNRKKKMKRSKDSKIFISNSLYMRRQWLEQKGGFGVIPSTVHARAGKDDLSVTVIAQENLSPTLWKKIEQILKSVAY